MNKHVHLNPAWFEPGADGESPFVSAYYAEELQNEPVGDSISAAFRALIAQDEQANIRDAELFEQQVLNDEPPALQVGDVVRLEAVDVLPKGFAWVDAMLNGSTQTVIGIDSEKDSVFVDDNGPFCWPRSALTLVRRAGEPAPVEAAGLIHDRKIAEEQVEAKDAELRESLDRTKLALNTTRQQRDQFWSQRDAARAEVERLKNECSDQQSYVLDLESAIARKDTRIKVLEVANDSLTQYSSNLTAERDALQARFDAGVRVFHGKYIDSNQPVPQEMLTGILLEPQPLADTQGTTTNVTVNDLQKRQFEGMLIKSDATTPAFDGTPTDIIHGTTLDQSDHIVEPNKMVDERKGERRQTQFIGHVSETTGERIYPRDGEGYQPASRTFPVNRRRTAGTIADRGKK